MKKNGLKHITVLLFALWLCAPAVFGQNVPSAGKNQPGSKHSKHSLFEFYKGLVMAGYQGWFNAPDDGAGRGWNHYHSRGAFEPGNCKFNIYQ